MVTQRTEILAGTLAENITLFERRAPRRGRGAPSPSSASTEWVAGLPDGLDTMLGPGGTTLSAGEEQLVAFARLLVRDVRVVVLDEATARMDPVTEARVVRAADRLLSGRTGILVAHRLSTTERAEQVAVLEAGRVVQQGPRGRLAARPGRSGRCSRRPRRTHEAAPRAEGTHRHDGCHRHRRVGTARRAGRRRPSLGCRRPGLARASAPRCCIQPAVGPGRRRALPRSPR